jgi:hypothetical protein
MIIQVERHRRVFFSLEHAGELRIIILRMEKSGLKGTEEL